MRSHSSLAQDDVEARERLAAIVESSEDAIIGKNLQGVIQSWNAGAQKIFGYAEAEAVGQHISLIIPEHLWSEEDSILARLRRGERIAHFETVRRHKDGTFLDISLSVSPIHGASGDIVGASKVARNITRERQLRKALADMNAELAAKVRERTQELERSIQELDSFNNAVAHDLRTPLRAIMGFSRLLLDSPRLTPEEREHVRFMVESSEQMNRITQALLKLSRIRPDRIKRTPVDLTATARLVVERLRAGSSRSVEVEIEDGLRAHADAALTEILLQNVLGNAWKFSQARTPARIHVGRAVRKGKQMFFVRDNGVGFRPEEGVRILGGFRRLRPREFEGSGIGLTTVSRIVGAHGGKVFADGVPDEGAAVWFSLDDPLRPRS